MQILAPAQGVYQITVTGVTQGPYVLGITAISQDGTTQPRVTFPGIADVGTTATFQVQLTPPLEQRHK